MWDSGSTYRMDKSWHNKPYELNMRSNHVEYSTAEGPYCMKNDVKVPFYMPEFSIINIISHCVHIHNNDGESEIGYDMNIGCDLMVQTGRSA